MKNNFLFPILLSGLLSIMGMPKYSCAQNEVIYTWCGGLTPYSINVNAKLTNTSCTVRLVFSQTLQFSFPLYSSFYCVDTNANMMVAMSMSGLTPNTQYYYAVESGGILDSSSDDVGSFKTCHSGPSSFSFVAGSCCINSNHGVYDVMKGLDPLFFSCTGDLHYGNPNSATNVNDHRVTYENLVLSKPRAASFFKKVPIEYVWDDHDFSGNDSDSSFVGKANARRAYREYVPHYPLPAGNGNNAIYQSFVIGRVHFIHTDLRSDRYGTSMMGSVQKIWFKNECVAAKNNNEIICWLNSTTWSGNTTDNWGGFTSERTELANFFRDSLIENMFIICGDAHMLGIDDGSHGDFATFVNNGSRYPLLAAAALNQAGSYKGGTFSEGGYFSNPSSVYGQFGLVTVEDTGGADICISFDGYRCDSLGGSISFMDHYQFCRTIDASLVGINNNDRSSTTSTLFPNPSEGRFIFKTDAELMDPNVLVTDVSGKIIDVRNNYEITKRSIQFDLRSLDPGCYFICVSDKDHSSVRKVMITK